MDMEKLTTLATLKLQTTCVTRWFCNTSTGTHSIQGQRHLLPWKPNVWSSNIIRSPLFQTKIQKKYRLTVRPTLYFGVFKWILSAWAISALYNPVERYTAGCYSYGVSLTTYLVRQHLLPERSTEIQSLQHWVTVAGVAKLERKKKERQRERERVESVYVLCSSFNS